MELIIHYPKDNQAIHALNEKVSMLHGEYILSYLEGMDCSKEQKIKIIENIRNKV